jgi:hypothetical protein
VSGFVFLVAIPEFYSHLATWPVVIRTPDYTSYLPVFGPVELDYGQKKMGRDDKHDEDGVDIVDNNMKYFFNTVKYFVIIGRKRGKPRHLENKLFKHLTHFVPAPSPARCRSSIL